LADVHARTSTAKTTPTNKIPFAFIAISPEVLSSSRKPLHFH
jgi:hypothetical protein